MANKGLEYIAGRPLFLSPDTVSFRDCSLNTVCHARSHYRCNVVYKLIYGEYIWWWIHLQPQQILSHALKRHTIASWNLLWIHSMSLWGWTMLQWTHISGERQSHNPIAQSNQSNPQSNRTIQINTFWSISQGLAIWTNYCTVTAYPGPMKQHINKTYQHVHVWSWWGMTDKQSNGQKSTLFAYKKYLLNYLVSHNSGDKLLGTLLCHIVLEHKKVISLTRTEHI